MMTRSQIAAKIKKLGYEYAQDLYSENEFVEKIAEFIIEKNGDHDKVVSAMDYWIESGGDAYPEQVWGWAGDGDYEWIARDGTIKWLDEKGNVIEGVGSDFVQDFGDGVVEYIEEHYPDNSASADKDSQ